MQQIPPPQLPLHSPALPARPAVVPVLPTRLRQPGRQAPLPDAVAVRRLAVPDPAPPFDDEIPAPASDLHAGNGAMDPAASRPAAAGLPPEPDRERADPGCPPPDGEPRGPGSGSPPGRSRGDPPPPDGGGTWPSQFAQVLAETLAGSRSVQQLTPWTTEQARKRIRQLGPLLATDQRPRVRRVMTSAPAAGVLELTAVVGFGPRVRVLALRLEREQARPYRRSGGQWSCTAIESA